MSLDDVGKKDTVNAQCLFFIKNIQKQNEYIILLYLLKKTCDNLFQFRSVLEHAFL